MTKQEKCNLINEAISRSAIAIKKQANAHILPDGRLEYTMTAPNGRYIVKATFTDIIELLDGEDIQHILKAINHKYIREGRIK